MGKNYKTYLQISKRRSVISWVCLSGIIRLKSPPMKKPKRDGRLSLSLLSRRLSFPSIGIRHSLNPERDLIIFNLGEIF